LQLRQAERIADSVAGSVRRRRPFVNDIDIVVGNGLSVTGRPV